MVPGLSSHTAVVCVTQLCVGNLTLTVAGAQSVTEPYAYMSLVQLARIDGFLPRSGPTAGGTALTIVGSNFGMSGNVTLQPVAGDPVQAQGEATPCAVTLYRRTEIR
jgi:hypothetical protein